MARPAGKIDFLDFAKGYAIFTIVCYHTLQRVEMAPMLQKAIIFGGSGVHLFFLLSGFGLGLSSSSRGVWAFYRRRATKVWLPYVLALSISWALAASIGLFADGWKEWLAGVALYQMFYEPFIHSFGGHFWFISAIIQFYLVYPLLIWIKGQFSNAWNYFFLCLAISVAWWLVVFQLGTGSMRTWNSFFLQFLWEFALGQVWAGQYQALQNGKTEKNVLKPDFWNYTWWKYLPAGLLFTGLMIAMILKMGDAGKIFNDIPALIGYSAICIFLYHVGLRFVQPLKQLFRWIGGFSYSLYLVHIMVLEGYLLVLGKMGMAQNLPVLLLYLPLALLGGWAFEPLSRAWIRLFETKH